MRSTDRPRQFARRSRPSRGRKGRGGPVVSSSRRGRIVTGTSGKKRVGRRVRLSLDGDKKEVTQCYLIYYNVRPRFARDLFSRGDLQRTRVVRSHGIRGFREGKNGRGVCVICTIGAGGRQKRNFAEECVHVVKSATPNNRRPSNGRAEVLATETF